MADETTPSHGFFCAEKVENEIKDRRVEKEVRDQEEGKRLRNLLFLYGIFVKFWLETEKFVPGHFHEF